MRQSELLQETAARGGALNPIPDSEWSGMSDETVGRFAVSKYPRVVARAKKEQAARNKQKKEDKKVAKAAKEEAKAKQFSAAVRQLKKGNKPKEPQGNWLGRTVKKWFAGRKERQMQKIAFPGYKGRTEKFLDKLEIEVDELEHRYRELSDEKLPKRQPCRPNETDADRLKCELQYRDLLKSRLNTLGEGDSQMSDNHLMDDDDMPIEIEELIHALLAEGFTMDEVESIMTDKEFIDDLTTIMDMSDEELTILENDLDDEDEVLSEMGMAGECGTGMQEPATKKGGAVTDSVMDKLGKIVGKKYTRKTTEGNNLQYDPGRMLHELSRGRCEWGTVGTILAGSIVNKIKWIHETERNEVIEFIYTDKEAFQGLVSL